MTKRTSVMTVVLVIAGMLVLFLYANGQLNRNLDEVNQQYEQARVKLTDLQNEQSDLSDTLKASESEAFVENQARTLYGYMKPDEIRFVITNPEALYSTETEE